MYVRALWKDQQYKDRIDELEGELQIERNDLEAKEDELEALNIKYFTQQRKSVNK